MHIHIYIYILTIQFRSFQIIYLFCYFIFNLYKIGIPLKIVYGRIDLNTTKMCTIQFLITFLTGFVVAIVLPRYRHIWLLHNSYMLKIIFVFFFLLHFLRLNIKYIYHILFFSFYLLLFAKIQCNCNNSL